MAVKAAARIRECEIGKIDELTQAVHGTHIQPKGYSSP